MKTKRTLLTGMVLLAMAALTCEIPPYPAGNEGTTEGLGGAKQPPVLAVYPSVQELGIDPLSEPVPANFIRGVDISNCYIIEQAGGVYYDDDGTPGDIITILADHGVNYVRLRLWHNHKLAYSPGPYNGDGDNDIVKTKAIARRAKQAGMKFLLNFHYSDNWADPGRQQIPDAWKNFTIDQIVQAVYDYTFDTIMELKAAGAEPDMVQIGNEITPGMLRTTSGSGGTITTDANLGRVLEQGILATRLAAPNAQIMLHLDSGGDVNKYNNWFDRFAAHNGTAATVRPLDFDVIGLSWYPYYSSHKTIDDLDTNIRNIQSRYGKEAVVAEFSWAWTKEFDGDDLSNLFHTSQENQTKTQLTDGNGYVSASGLVFQGSALPAGIENQAKITRAVLDAVVTSGGMGVFWWAADWIPAAGLKSNWDNQTLFDFNGKALPALSVLGGLPGAGNAPPGKPKNLRSTAADLNSISLAWDAVYGADKYALYRASDETGPWDTPLDDELTAAAYTDTSLAPGTTYYYRVSAHNAHGWGNMSNVLTKATNALTPPAGFGVTGTDSVSITLGWTAVTGVTAYKIYHAGPAADEPDASTFSILTGADNITQSTTAFTHNGLTGGDKHWYRITAVYGLLGESPRSAAISGTVGAASPAYASIDMNTGTLDADFQDSAKAVTSSSSLSSISTNNGQNYDISNLYVANDANNLYVALDFGSTKPAGWNNNRMVVVIDNTNSTVGGADTSVLIAGTQTFSNSPTIEGYASLVLNISAADISSAAATVSPAGVAVNAANWTSNSGWLGTPVDLNGGTVYVIKFAIPLSSIYAGQNDALKIFAAFSQHWSQGGSPEIGDIIPSSAASGTASAATSITIDMDQALSYTVK
jgi:arabinogalactan endo-1,4-beta-galactosidase